MTEPLSSDSISTKQARIAQLARNMPHTALRSLAHRIDLEWMRLAHRRTRKDGAVGVDGCTAEDYAHNLDENLTSLLQRAKDGTYRAPPVRRVHIPKPGGKTRPIGVPTFEDKVLQRALVMLLEPVYETHFYDFSYGFRPRRSAHDAVFALRNCMMQMNGGWVLDIDIEDFFGSIPHAALRELVRQRVIDGVVTRLIGKWLRAGVLSEGRVRHPDAGSPQGGVLSPLLSNIYLHEVTDRWWVEEVLPGLSGQGHLIRYADDLVMVFSDKREAQRVLSALRARLSRYGLRLHPDKTRLVRFERPPRDGSGPRPETFGFLGFTHVWSRSRHGSWVVKQHPCRHRHSRAMSRLNAWLRGVRHAPLRVQAQGLARRLRGHFQYYGIRGNSRRMDRFRRWAMKRWRRWLSRRSQKGRVGWARFARILRRYPLPPAHIVRHNAQLRWTKG